VSLTASFRGSKVRQKIIREKSKIYILLQKIKKNTKLSSKKVLGHKNRWKNALFTANYVINRFFFALDQNFSKIHKTNKEKFLVKTKKYVSYDIE
jgi:hypothetical protein